MKKESDKNLFISPYKKTIQKEETRFLPAELSTELKEYYEGIYGKLVVDSKGRVKRKVKSKFK